MADNLTALANTGTGTDVLATDEIAGVHYPRSKIGWGVDGVFVDASASNPLPVALPPGAATETTLAALNAKLNVLSMIPDDDDPGIVVRPVGQYTWVCSFASVGASVLSPDFRAPDVGTGVTYNQALGQLNIVAGTTANAEFLTRSLESWRGTMQMRFSLVSSQRIAQTNFAVILADLIGENLSVTVNSATSITVSLPGHTYTAQNVGQFMFVGGISGVAGVPGRYAIASVVAGVSVSFTVAGWPGSGSGTADLFGHSHVKHLYTGTTATNVAADTQRRGWAAGDSTLTILTTQTPGHIMQAHNSGRELYWLDTLRASVATPNMTARGSRFENLPDDDLDLYLFLWSYNGTSNPASSTTWTVGFVSVEKFANTPVYVQGQEMQGSVAAAPVAIVGTPAVSISGTPAVTLTSTTVTASTPATPTTTNAIISSAASTNGTILKGTAGTVFGVAVSNINAAVRYLKLYNSATVTVGTTTPAITIPIPANGVVSLDLGPQGMRFSAGICLAMTTGAADGDTGGVALNEIKSMVSYI
jgi:hypothetical protein